MILLRVPNRYLEPQGMGDALTDRPITFEARNRGQRLALTGTCEVLAKCSHATNPQTRPRGSTRVQPNLNSRHDRNEARC
jgi:hypothetical protein